MSRVIEVVSEAELELFTDSLSKKADEKIRIKNDFLEGYFKGLMVYGDETKSSALGCLVFFNTYSTWQHRTFFVSDIWLNDVVEDEEKLNVLKKIFDKLLKMARDNDINRINMNLNIGDQVIEWVKSFGAIDLSEKEDWYIMEMQDKDIKEFISETAVLDPKFSIKKVENIKDFSLLIKNLIFELAVFEKMEIQCEITEPGLVIDYEWAKATKFNGKEVKDRFYELSVVTMEETCEKTGKKNRSGSWICHLLFKIRYEIGTWIFS